VAKVEEMSQSSSPSTGQKYGLVKESLLWIRRFDTVEEFRLALLEFKDTYNRQWIIGRHGSKTPAAVRAIQKEAGNVAA
jgi:hypothetical protein